MICLLGLAHRCSLSRRQTGGETVGDVRSAGPAGRAGWVRRTRSRARPRRRSSGSTSATSASRSSGRTAGRNRTPSYPSAVQASTRSATSAAEPVTMRASVAQPPARESSRASRCGAGLAAGVEHDREVGDHAQRARRCARRSSCAVADLGEDRRRRGVVVRRHEHDVGRARGELVRDGRVRQRGHHRLALRRARRDRRAAHREPRRLDVDAVHLVAVDEAAGLDVADLGVVLPAVPQRADGLDDRGGLVEPLADELGPAAGQVVLERQGREVAAPGQRRLVDQAPTPAPASPRGRGSCGRAWPAPWRRGTARCGWS